MEDKKFEIEGQIEDDELTEELEDEEEEYYERGPGIYILLVVFIVLFLTVSSLFVYYQFYLGNGNWDFSFKKRVNENVLINDDLQEENSELKAKVESLEAELATTETNEVDTSSNASTMASGSSSLFTEDMAGEKFEVQIGAFSTFNFSKYDPNLVNMNVENVNGVDRLTIGRFDNFDDACAFRKDIMAMGIQGAFVIKKVDGKKVKFDAWCP